MKALLRVSQKDKVEVNQRGLIDKILSRYSSPFTVFRELLQNADDAGNVTNNSVSFHTQTLPHILTPSWLAFYVCFLISVGARRVEIVIETKDEEYHRVLIINDGRPFENEDWERYVLSRQWQSRSTFVDPYSSF